MLAGARSPGGRSAVDSTRGRARIAPHLCGLGPACDSDALHPAQGEGPHPGGRSPNAKRGAIEVDHFTVLLLTR